MNDPPVGTSKLGAIFRSSVTHPALLVPPSGAPDVPQHGGGYASSRTAPPHPKASAELAAIRISGLTACAMLEGTGKVQPGETVCYNHDL